MTRFIPTVAAALFLTTLATPVLAQAAVQEPGLAAFNHPNADVLNGGRSRYRALESANAYYNEAARQVRRHRATHKAN